MVYQAIVAVGSNLSAEGKSPENIVNAAFSALEEGGASGICRSRLYRSEAVPAGSGPDFVNAVICCQTPLDAPDFLALLHRIEADFERQRPARWAPRTLDLDLIDHGGQICPDRAGWAHWANLPPEAQQRDAPEALILPHPRMQDRAFVLVPLCDVAPDWSHPVLGQSAAQMRDALPARDLAQLTPIEGLPFMPEESKDRPSAPG